MKDTVLMRFDRRVFLGSTIAVASVPLAAGMQRGVAQATTTFAIVQSGRPVATVVVAAEADDQTRYAAGVLIDYVHQATGATLPQVNWSGTQVPPDAGPRIYVGMAAPGSGVGAAELSALSQDGYLIRRTEGALTIAGRDGWGTRYGVYAFCERYLDVRWLMTDDVVIDEPSVGRDVPPRSSLSVTQADVTETPAMMERILHPLVIPQRQSHAWDWEPGDSRVRTYTDSWGRFARLRHALEYQHNLWRVISPAKYGDPKTPATYRPDFFPLHDGETDIPPAGRQTGWQPRFTADGIVDAAAAEVLTYLRAHPDATAYSLSVNDGQGFSDDDLDTSVTNHLGFASASEHYFAFVNGVAEQVAAEFPHVILGVLAYTQVADPPSFPLHPNVLPMLTKDLYGWTRVDVLKADQPWIEKWHRTASQLGVWDYAWGNPYALPRLYLHSLGESFRFLRQHGVVAVMAQMSPGWGEGPKPYVYAKLMWDPDQDVATLVREWCERVAGQRAAPHLESYFQLWEQFWTVRAPKSSWFDFSSHRTWFLQINADYLELVTTDDLTRAQRYLDEAAAVTDTVEQKGRVAALRTTFDYYRAGALSYPRRAAAPVNRTGAVRLVDDTAGLIDRSISAAQHRLELSHRIDGVTKAGSPFWSHPSMVWSGWQLDPAWQIGEYIRAKEPTGGPVRSHVQQLTATTDSTDVRGLADLMLGVADGRAADRNANPSFEPSLPQTWQADGASVVDEAARSGSTSLKLPRGWRGVVSWEAPVQPGLFRFQIYLHTPHEKSGVDGKLVTRLYGADGKVRQQLSTTFSLDRSQDDWHQVAHTEMAQYDVVRASCTVVTIDSPGLPAPCYLDDASIFSLPYATTPPGAVVVEQDQFRISPTWAQVVDDAEAIDGKAARLLGSQVSWGVQYPLSRMPASGTFRLHARVRLDITGEVDDDTTVLYIGVYRADPRYSRREAYAASTFADGEYHWLDVDLSEPLTHDTRGMYVYFTGLGGNTNVPWIFIDRLYLIPA